MTNSCNPCAQTELIKIGELAELAGLGVGTIRYYETLGLLQPAHRSPKGYRYYSFEAIARLQFIKKAQVLRFSLTEIQQILGVRQQGNPACPMVRAFLERKISELDEQIVQMQNLKAELEGYRDRWREKPLDDPDNKALCSLIAEVNYNSQG